MRCFDTKATSKKGDILTSCYKNQSLVNAWCDFSLSVEMTTQVTSTTGAVTSYLAKKTSSCERLLRFLPTGRNDYKCHLDERSRHILLGKKKTSSRERLMRFLPTGRNDYKCHLDGRSRHILLGKKNKLPWRTDAISLYHSKWRYLYFVFLLF